MKSLAVAVATGVVCFYKCTQRGRPVAMLRGLDDDYYSKTRLAQYEATKIIKEINIDKQLVSA